VSDTFVVDTHTWEPMPEYRCPYPIRVTLHEDVERLNAWRAHEFPDDVEDEGQCEGVTVYDEDDDEYPAVIHLAKDALHLATITHEVAHWALFQHGHHVLAKTPHARARRHVLGHDEDIPYLIGNVTSMLVFSLSDMGLELDPKTPAPAGE
jgi:hypothetical protein